MSGSTLEEGVVGELVYIENGLEANLLNVKDKIVILNGRIRPPVYEMLIKAEVKAFISLSGSVYDDINNTDLAEASLREQHYKHGKIPGVSLRVLDGQEMILKEASLAKLTLIQEEGKRQSHNVVTKIEGTTFKDKIVGITAHYDSVRFSKGAFDNATGSATILELIRHFKKHPPKRTLQFVWCGSEEMGLLGAKAFVRSHPDLIKNFEFVINVDMTGVTIGYDQVYSTADKSLVTYLEYFAKEEGFPIISRQGVYPSDSTPFADAGIPAVTFARQSGPGGAEIHTRRDVVDNLDAKSFYKTSDFIIKFAERVINSTIIPVPRVIPEEMKLELDYYNGRKKRPER